MRIKVSLFTFGIAVLLGMALLTYSPTATAQQDPTPTVQAEDGMAEMGTMDMSGMTGGLTTNDLAPLAMALYEGETIFFIHTEASDPDVAQVLTEMMGPTVLTVPSLAEIPAELLGNAYVFTNGIAGDGPLGFQPDIFDSIPGDEAYTPLRAINLVTWQETVEPRELDSVSEVIAAQEAGEVIVEQPGVVVNMPVLMWADEHR